MNSLKVLVTGAGAPGFWGTHYSLVNNYDNRKVEIIGTDCKEDVYGKFMCDNFYVIPKANDDAYLPVIEKIYEREKIDVLLPQNTNEIEKLTHSKMRVAGRDALANDKDVVMRMAETCGIPFPKYYEVDNRFDLICKINESGYPKKRVVVKPSVSNGSRGMRIIDDNLDYHNLFFNEKVNNFIRRDVLMQTLNATFPKLLVMEYLEGDEYTVDCFRSKDKFVAIPRLREEIKNGITWKSRVVKNDELIEYSRRLAEGLHLKFAFGFQFIGDKILECNPRVQGTMVASTFAGANLIYSAVKLALKEPIPEFNINWDSRTIRHTICREI